MLIQTNMMCNFFAKPQPTRQKALLAEKSSLSRAVSGLQDAMIGRLLIPHRIMLERPEHLQPMRGCIATMVNAEFWQIGQPVIWIR